MSFIAIDYYVVESCAISSRISTVVKDRNINLGNAWAKKCFLVLKYCYGFTCGGGTDQGGVEGGQSGGWESERAKE